MANPPYKQTYPTVPQGGSPRKTEAWALLEAAKRMKSAQGEPISPEAILAAARINWKLWTIFQASLAHPDCGWPDDMRGNLLSLCNFVDRHIAEIIATPEPTKLDVLIKINREIAAGLYVDPVPGSEPAKPEAATGSATPGPVNRSA